VDFRLAQNVVAALLGLPWMRQKKQRFASAIDQKHPENNHKTTFTIKKDGILQKTFVLFHPHHRDLQGYQHDFARHENPLSTTYALECTG